MSKIAVSSPASGTATYTISAPAGSTDRTISLPDNTGTILTTATAGVPVNGPAFNAFTAVTKAVATNVATEIAGYSTPIFDTASCFNTTTGRFTPTVAGYYQFSWSCDFGNNGIGAATVIGTSVYKNGTTQWNSGMQTSGAFFGAVGSSTVVYMNGSTDYASVYLFQNTGSTTPNFYARFAAALIRSAT